MIDEIAILALKKSGAVDVSIAVAAKEAAEAAQEAAETAQGKAEDAAEELEQTVEDVAELKTDVSSLKSHITNTDGSINTLDLEVFGLIGKSKLLVDPGRYSGSTNKLYSLNNVTIGTTTLSGITATASDGSYALKIPIDGYNRVKYPLFKSSSNFGSFILDENDVVLYAYTETSLDTGSYKTVKLPDGSAYLFLSISNSLSAIDWNVTLYGHSMDDLEERVAALETDVTEIGIVKRITKQDVTTPYYSTEKIYNTVNATIGTTKANQLTTADSANAFAVKIPLAGVKKLTYPMFKTTQYYGSFMCDAEDTVIYAHRNTTDDTGSYKEIDIPRNASYFILSITSSLNALNWYYEIDTGSSTDESKTPFSNKNRNICLCGIKTDILTNKIPYHRGFLFHSMDGDNALYYGTNLENAKLFDVAEYDVSKMRIAISPKDGRIIAVQRDTRNGIWIDDGNEVVHLNSFETNPMAWLYNSGVDFCVDTNGVEYCIFAEYNGNPSSETTFNVWRGTYPYTSASDWEIVMTESYSTIMHFHMVRRDPWSDILYLTSGDSDAQCNWWYSDDYGETWETLTTGATSGYPEQVCRTANFVFTEDWIYWATDNGTNHMLCKASRDGNGLLDVSSREKLCDLPSGYATNSICYVESPNGIFMYDRVDTGYTSQYGDPVTLQFWSIETEQLVDVATLGLTSETWGGSRGKCYVNYTNSKQTMPAMGFSPDTPCIFDIICDNPENIGTIAYDVGSKTVRTIDY